MKILVIDDETLDLFISKKLLEQDFEVEGFASIDKAVTWAAGNAFDVALIDYYLGPNLYAHNALKNLRDLKGDAFKAFVLSNYVDENQIRELKEAGFSNIIYKPLTLEKFKSALQAGL